MIAWFLIIISATSFTYSPPFVSEKACLDFANNFNNPMAVKMACLKAEVAYPVIVPPTAINTSITSQSIQKSK